MLPAEAVSEIVDVVNNRNRTGSAFTWLKATLYEIQRQARWNFLLKDATIPFARSVALPTDAWEIVEPVYLDTAMTTAGTWATPTAPWEFEKVRWLRTDKGDIRTSNFGIEFNTRWTTGTVWLKYYRSIVIPATAAATSALDLPEAFVYDLVVYGAARHGLTREDDYDRLKIAEEKYSKALYEMTVWDNRRKSANGILTMTDHTNPALSTGDGTPIWPANYSI